MLAATDARALPLVLYPHPPRLSLRGTEDLEKHPIRILSSRSLACVQYCLLAGSAASKQIFQIWLTSPFFQAGVPRRVVCPAALDAALRMVSSTSTVVQQDVADGSGGGGSGNDADDAAGGDGAGGGGAGGAAAAAVVEEAAAAAAAAEAHFEDVGMYAFELVEKVLQVGDSAYRCVYDVCI